MLLKEIRLFLLDEMYLSEKVVINVGGIWYEIYMVMFKNILDIRLFWIMENKM